MDNFLIGKNGSDVLFEELSIKNPVQVIRQFQADNSLSPVVDM